MPLENEDQDQASAEAAFAASFEDKATPAPVDKTQEAAKADKPVDQPVDKPKEKDAASPAPSPVPTLTAEDIAEMRATASRVAELDANLRKAHGRIGSLTDQLQQSLKSKEADGKPAALTKPELKRLKEEFPEMAALLVEDISAMLSTLKPEEAKHDPEAIKALAQEMITKEVMTLRIESLAHRHPDWQDLRDKPPAEYAAWMKSLSDKERTDYLNSNNPHFIAARLDEYKVWRDKAAKAKQKSQQRVEAAVTPQGTARGSTQALSDDEAARIAFEKSFNS